MRGVDFGLGVHEKYVIPPSLSTAVSSPIPLPFPILTSHEAPPPLETPLLLVGPLHSKSKPDAVFKAPARVSTSKEGKPTLLLVVAGNDVTSDSATPKELSEHLNYFLSVWSRWFVVKV